MAKTKTVKQLGQYTKVIEKALFKNTELLTLLLGNLDGKSPAQIRNEFKDHVKAHLFVDETIENTWDYIFFDAYIPRVRENIKYPQIRLFCISHRDMLDNFDSPIDDEGDEIYPGNRPKAILYMIENTLINDPEVAEKIGIGKLDFDGINVFRGDHYYGYMVDFQVKEFR